MISYSEKCSSLLAAVDRYTDKDIIIAFSGGVDSSLLLKLACEYAKNKKHKVYAITMHTELHPINDIVVAKKVAEEVGAIHFIIRIDELQNAGIKNNPINRCYLCKKHLFSKLREEGEKLQITTILDGTNEEDRHVYRPGIKAIKELGIKSPLADSRMTKQNIRQMASEYGVSVAERPANPCLATRFPYGTLLIYENMHKVEKAEAYVRGFGIYNVRVRVHGDIARIEVDEQDISKLIVYRKEVISYFKNLGYEYITIDMQGFCSGSMDYKVREK